jgi:hypothetical protein
VIHDAVKLGGGFEASNWNGLSMALTKNENHYKFMFSYTQLSRVTMLCQEALI